MISNRDILEDPLDFLSTNGMEQMSSPTDKAISAQDSLINVVDGSLPELPERAQSSGVPRAPPSDSIRQEQEEAPPVPLKDRSESASVDLTQLGDFTFYKPTSSHVASTIREELPPDFLEPTAEDLKSAQASLVARSRAYQEAPLLTDNLRKKRDEEFRNRWPTTTIRIRFADRSILEKSFPSSSMIKPVYAFVRSCLLEDVKPHKFVLYEPPRRELRVSDPNVRDKNLLDLHLAPRTVLNFRFLEEHVKLDPVSGPPPLCHEILARAVDLPLPPSQDSGSPPSSAAQSTLKSSKLVDTSGKDKKIARLLKFTKGKK